MSPFLPADPRLETAIKTKGEKLFALMDQQPPPALFSKKGAYARLMEWSMKDPAFKTQLFRFVDVLPTLQSSGEIVRHLQEYLALQDFIDRARKILPRPIYGYVTGGVEDNVSLRGNRNVFDEIGLVPKPLVDTTARSMKTTLFGKTYNAPFGFAPMGGTSTACYRGDTVLASVAAEANIPMMMSGASLMKMEDVKAAGATAMFQAYLPGDIERSLEIPELIDESEIERCFAGQDTAVGVFFPVGRKCFAIAFVVGGGLLATVLHDRFEFRVSLHDHVLDHFFFRWIDFLRRL